jgi:hypothetical protein
MGLCGKQNLILTRMCLFTLGLHMQNIANLSGICFAHHQMKISHLATELPLGRLHTKSGISRYCFGVSSPGIGYECFRTYEMLLLGIIPIIEDMQPNMRPKSSDRLRGLPVIIIPNMQKATHKQQFMDVIWSFIASGKFQNASFEEGWGHLFFQHNRQEMLKDAKRIK